MKIIPACAGTDVGNEDKRPRVFFNHFFVFQHFKCLQGLRILGYDTVSNLRYLTKEDVINSVLEVVDDSIELRYNSS